MSVSELYPNINYSLDVEKEKKNDEVDFIVQVNKDANHNNILLPHTPPKKTSIYGDCEEVKNSIKSGLTTLEKFSFFTLKLKSSNRNSSGHGQTELIEKQQAHRDQKHSFARSASISRFFGNNYNTKKYENELRTCKEKTTKPINFDQQEKFHQLKENGDCDNISLTDFPKTGGSLFNENILGTKAFQSISRGIGKLRWKRSHRVVISLPDPEYKVFYLGNVLTGWAKGEGCVEKPLNTLWRNYTQNSKPDVMMRVVVCASGLKATTRQHGLTEYWANRITHCCAPKNFPRIFCWIYRHEGRKFKHEMRCHAVLCTRENIAHEICNTLKDNLHQALKDFKKEKILKQNARLSLANAAYENPSLPRRKIMLSVGGNNYRPPLERSKSAPKLMAIEEAIGEEEGDDIEDTNEPEMLACCQKDSLYPAMTLGRRRCRRGHSIRRTGRSFLGQKIRIGGECDDYCKSDINTSLCSNSDEDELGKVLSYNNYNTESPLAVELMSFFDMKLHKATSLSNLVRNDESNKDDFDEDMQINTNPSPKLQTALSFDILDNYSEESCALKLKESTRELSELEDFESDELFFRQAAILNLLHRSSLRKMAKFSMSNSEEAFKHRGFSGSHQLSLDSDEGSISSGCDTASTVTIKEQECVTPPPKTFVKAIKFNLKEDIIPLSPKEDGSDSDESGYEEYSVGRKIEGLSI